jgi:hypothetical protein
MTPVRCANRHQRINRRSECSGMLGDETSHRVTHNNDGVVDEIQLLDQIDQAIG